MMHWIKAHPIWATVGGIVVLYLLYRMLSGGGSTAPAVYSSSADSNAVAAATALAQAQLAQQGQTQQTQAALEAQNAQIAGQVTIAQLGQQLGLAQIAADQTTMAQQTAAATQIAQMQAESTNLASTLAAQIQQAGINAQTQQAQIAAHTTEIQAQTMQQMNEANQQTLQQQIMTEGQTTQQLIRTQGQVQQQQIKSNSGWCFLTTAACEVLGQPDDCYVLQTLRAYREGWVKIHAAEALAEYKNISQVIIERLDKRHDKMNVYYHAWFEYILPAVHCVERGQNRAAYALYGALVNELLAISSQTVDTPREPLNTQAA